MCRFTVSKLKLPRILLPLATRVHVWNSSGGVHSDTGSLSRGQHDTPKLNLVLRRAISFLAPACVSNAFRQPQRVFAVPQRQVGAFLCIRARGKEYLYPNLGQRVPCLCRNRAALLRRNASQCRGLVERFGRCHIGDVYIAAGEVLGPMRCLGT